MQTSSPQTFSTVPPGAPDAERRHAQRFVKRVYFMRILALVLGLVTVATVLYRVGAPIAAWIILLVYVFSWPHMAYAISRRSNDALRAENLNIMLDCALAGAWLALMHFSLLPSATLVMPLGMLMIANGGLWLLFRGFAAIALVAAIIGVTGDMGFQPDSTLPEIIASLPLLLAIPMLTSMLLYRLERRVRSQNRLLLKVGSLDGVSGLLNRRSWEESAAQSLDAHRSAGRPAAMLLIDIDNFKCINDQYGHTVGDDVIARVGALIRSSLRDGDLAGRYGGDEFAVVLVNADLRAAALVAERIRAGVAGSLFECAPGLRCTLSIGIATSQAAGFGETRQWVKDADAALYRAKLAGRDRFVVA